MVVENRVDVCGASTRLTSRVRQCKCHKAVARLRAQFAATACRNGDVLAAFDGVSAWRRVTASVEFVLPKEFAVLLIECVEFFVFRSPNENQAAGRNNRAAEIFRAGLRNA